MAQAPWTSGELAAASTILFRQPRQVKLQECDAAGIVFFARFFEYFHDALMAGMESAGFSVPDLLRTGAVLIPLREAQADYLAPVFFGDPIQVELVRTHVEDSKAWIGYRISGERGKVHATGRTLHLCIDRAGWTRKPLPPELARVLTSFGGGD